MSEMSLVPSACARKPRGTLATALGACALSAVLLFGAGTGTAQADPIRAEQIMESFRIQKTIFDVHMQYAYMHIDAGQTTSAQVSLQMAYSKTVGMTIEMEKLYLEHRLSRENGQYTNLAALDRAIEQAMVAKVQFQILKAYLYQFQLSPTSSTLRANVEMQRVKLKLTLRLLEQAMAEA